MSEHYSREEWLAKQKHEYDESGSDLSFEDWQNWRFEQGRAERERQDQDEREAELRALRVGMIEGQIPVRYKTATTDLVVVLSWADLLAQTEMDGPTGPSLLLTGPTGTGKTHAMYAALRRYAHAKRSSAAGRYRPLVAVATTDLYAHLRPRPGQDSEAEFKRYADTNLLALDDLGSAKGSEWVDEINYRLINHRYNRQLPTIITTNCAPGQLATVLSERVASRLAEMCTVVPLKGTDRRRTAA